MTDFPEKTKKQQKSIRGPVVLALFAITFAAGIFLPSHAAWAAITLVDTAQYGDTGGDAAISATLNVSSGNLIVVHCSRADDGVTGDQTSVSDTAGNLFYKVASTFPIGSFGLVDSLWYAKNTVGSASDTITCNFVDSVADREILALQYSGIDRVAPLDAQSNGYSYGETAVTSSAFSTAASSEVIIACAAMDNVDEFSAGSGYTIQVPASGSLPPLHSRTRLHQ